MTPIPDLADILHQHLATDNSARRHMLEYILPVFDTEDLLKYGALQLDLELRERDLIDKVTDRVLSKFAYCLEGYSDTSPDTLTDTFYDMLSLAVDRAKCEFQP